MPEFDLIDKYFKPLAKDEAALGLLDDASILNPRPGHSLVLCKDMMVEGVHYDQNTPVDLLAKKLLRVNLSDLAAMGASPLGYLLGISLPKTFSQAEVEQWLAEFTKGLLQDQEKYEVSLFGGDTVSVDGEAVLSLTMIGEVPIGQAIKRTTAEVGDIVLVTGCLGDAALALNIAKHGWQIEPSQKQYLFDRLYLPTPRLEAGAELRGIATSAVDVSDGLLADLAHIADGSKVAVDVSLHKLPLSNAAKLCLASEKNPLDNFWPQIYGGGDDYELVVTIPPAKLAGIIEKFANIGLALTEIGVVKQGLGVNLLDDDHNKIPVQKCGYEHFNG